jgi:hypothetical protein
MIHKKARVMRYVLTWLGLNSLMSACIALSEAKTTDNSSFPPYWLTTSMYAGPFYDNDKLNLIDYRIFSAIDDAQTIDGYIVYPPKETQTIPAGSLVKILQISYPDDKSVAKRPIYSPRQQIWIYLKVAKERGLVSIFHEKPYILIIPKSIINKKQLNGYLAKFFSKKNPNEWILTLESHIQDGIFNKKPIVGMKKEQLLATLGPASKKQYKKRSDFREPQEIWHYHNYFIVMVNNVVKNIKVLSHKSGNMRFVK